MIEEYEEEYDEEEDSTEDQEPDEKDDLGTGSINRFLDKIPFFRDFSKEEKKHLSEMKDNFTRFSPNEIIIQEGREGQTLYIILKGTVNVNIQAKTPITITKLHEGSVFGEMSLLGRGPRTTSVIAETEVISMNLDPDTLGALDFMLQTKIKDSLFMVVLNRLDGMNRKMAQLIEAQSFKKF